MTAIHTHYDNLRVARNAPPEVIRAAYRALAQKHHPDVNPSLDSVRVMKLLNEAWNILGDKTRRAEHDAWIAKQESAELRIPPQGQDNSRKNTNRENYTYTSTTGNWRFETSNTQSSEKPKRSYTLKSTTQKNPAHDSRNKNSGSIHPTVFDQFQLWIASSDKKKYFVVAAVALAVVVALNQKRSPTPPQPPGNPITVEKVSDIESADVGRGTPELPIVAHNSSVPPPSLSTWSLGPNNELIAKPTTLTQSRKPDGSTAGFSNEKWSPDGRPWPVRSGYLQGQAIRAAGGLSKFTIDNTSGGSNVYVKLCRSSQDKCVGLRHIFITAGASFTMSDVAAGSYDIRYRDLQSGVISKSQPMIVRQAEEERATKFSVLRLTLYRVSEGNTTFEDLPDEKF